MAVRYEQIALGRVEYLRSCSFDPHALVVAVRYLGIYAIPRIRRDEQWFADTLDVLIKRFAPDEILEDLETVVPFLRSLRDAIDRNITNDKQKQM